MGLLSFRDRVFGNDRSKLLQELKDEKFEIAECDAECGDCSAKYPAGMKIEQDVQLWNSTNKYGVHILVGTGETNWEHDALAQKGLFTSIINNSMDDLEKTRFKNKGTVKLSACNLPEGEVLILPDYIHIFGATAETVVDEIKNNRTPDKSAGYIALCSHSTRDKRCGVTAPILKKQLDIELRHKDLYRDLDDPTPDGYKVIFVNHVGGHKFAANAIIYRREAGDVIWMARVKPSHARGIVEQTLVQGKVFPDLLRQAFKVNPIEW